MRVAEINEYAAERTTLFSYVVVTEDGVERFVLQFRGEPVDDYGNLIVKRRVTKRPFLVGRTVAWDSTYWYGVLDTEREVYYGLGTTRGEACDVALRWLADYIRWETHRLSRKPPKPREAVVRRSRRRRTFPMLGYRISE
jgi:hypothetical protein